MTSDDDGADETPAEEPDTGDLYVYHTQDINRVCTEAYYWLIQHPDIDKELALDITEMFRDLLLGGWMDHYDRHP